MKDFKEIVSKFQVDGEFKEAKPLGHGAINETYEIVCGDDHYVLQEINPVVFRHPADVMSNLFLVTEHLKKKIQEEGGDPKRETLEFIRTKEDNTLLQKPDRKYYRMYRMIRGAEAMEHMNTTECARHAAAAYGRFQKRLADLDISELSETIPRYHDTPYQMKQLLNAIRADICGRSSSCKKEIMFVLERSEKLDRIVRGIKSGEIPKRVTHNDTKCSNVLMDPETRQAVCVIDLDTVMPGSALYDFGDAIRSGASVDKGEGKTAQLDLKLFEAYTDGYLSELAGSLNDKEKELLVYSVWLMSMECGIRYLADYLGGDVYFSHVEYPEENLEKARLQFGLVLDIEKKREQMEEIVKKCLKKEA